MSLYRTIHGCARAAGLDEEAQRDVYERVTGLRSLSSMSADQKRAVAAEMKRLAPRRQGKAGGKGLAPRADLRLVHVLWRELGKADVLRDPGRKGLNRFIRSRFGKSWGADLIDIDMLTDHRQIDDVIQALKAWCDRAGVVLDD